MDRRDAEKVIPFFCRENRCSCKTTKIKQIVIHKVLNNYVIFLNQPLKTEKCFLFNKISYKLLISQLESFEMKYFAEDIIEIVE